jgi:hypothetical protein
MEWWQGLTSGTRNRHMGSTYVQWYVGYLKREPYDVATYGSYLACYIHSVIIECFSNRLWSGGRV